MVRAAEYSLFEPEAVEDQIGDRLREFVDKYVKGWASKFYLHIYIGSALTHPDKELWRLYYPSSNTALFHRKRRTIETVKNTIAEIKSGEYTNDLEKFCADVEGSKTSFLFFVSCTIKADKIPDI